MAHYSALQYWCAKWRGSEQPATEFAERAAASAPAGSLLTNLPLFAHFEIDDSAWAFPEGADTPRMRAAVDAALADADAADPGHPYLPAVRNVLAYYLTHQERWEAAAEHIRAVGTVGVSTKSARSSPTWAAMTDARSPALLASSAGRHHAGTVRGGRPCPGSAYAGGR
ncbi:hypothetical protein [Streptomyces sp. LN785]|uniref:hypothetical protein n=1 Tax=Streptomyces sp. LN785 TaxID=3112983 RepID=UPI00370FF377